MNPYRDNAAFTLEPRRTVRKQGVRKTIGALLFALQAFDVIFVIPHGAWALGVWGMISLVAIMLACVGRSRSAFIRLCALTWNRGDRLGATLLLFEVIQPRYSAKRIARNKAALAAAQVGMPKEWWFNSFAKRDDQ
jgi:hypothetical protein